MAEFRSETISTLAKALVKAQGEFPAIAKDKTAVVRSKRTGSSHSYNYADLPTILEATRPALIKHGLAVIQTLRSEPPALVTELIHDTGEWISGVVAIPPQLAPQELGSWLTYLRRYSLCGIIGVAADEDDDAASAQAAHGNRPTGSQTASGNGQGSAPQGGSRSAQIANPFVGAVAEVKTFKGESARGPWTRYVIVLMGSDGSTYEFSTFDHDSGDVAGSAAKNGSMLEIGFDVNQYGRTAKSVALVEGGPAGPAPTSGPTEQSVGDYPEPPDVPPHNDDDVPF